MEENNGGGFENTLRSLIKVKSNINLLTDQTRTTVWRLYASALKKVKLLRSYIMVLVYR